jgi:plasmid stabilization system protein ParE
MSYAVDWSQRAQDELADLWTNATDRNAVTAAADEVERLLSRDPLGQGESRSGNRRILFEPPLSVLYRVDPKRRTVTVITVGPTGPRP